jgi:NAD(P)H-hydrate epimerase
MQAIDAAAIDTVGIPRLLLMEHAGLAVARAVRTYAPATFAPVLVCCGTGFNGGDGLAAARHLREWGYPLRIVIAGSMDRLRDEPSTYATILRRLGVRLHVVTEVSELKPLERWLGACGLAIDALLGIGVRGGVREPMASLIRLLNRSGKPIIAVDIPSGLNGDTGNVQGVAVKASMTVTFGLPKRGCMVGKGPSHVGKLIADPITIPRLLLERRPP